MNATQKALTDALRLLTDVGWVKGSFEVVDEFGVTAGYCSIGAINAAAPVEGDARLDAEEALGEVAREVLPALEGRVAYSAITRFNDADTTTFEDVRAAFEEAIRRAG